MAATDFDKLNDKLQSTSTIFLFLVSIILLAFWYFVYGIASIYIPLVIVLVAFAVQHFLIRPRMEKTLKGLNKGKQ